MEPALTVEGVSHAFGKKQALDAVELTVRQGQFCALLGPNGAGKTTLFSLVTRLYDNVSGTIRVLGYDVRRKSSQALQNLGVVFQSRTVDADLSVMQNLTYHAALHGMPAKLARDRAEAELHRIGLADRARDKIRALSGGQVRRVEIARALIHRPRLLLLDEPTVGLDIESRQEIVAHVRSLVETEGLGVLWATHLVDELDQDDTVIVLHGGKVLTQESAGALITQTGEADLVGAFCALTGTKPPQRAAALA